MCDSPMTLQNCCMEFICNNLPTLCTMRPSASVVAKQTKMVFKDQETCLHNDLSDQLLSTLSGKGMLDDKTLSLFDPNVTHLQHVSIHNVHQVTCQGLFMLKGHKITKLEITGLREVTVNDIIRCLGEWSLSNLCVLNVSRNTFLNNAKLCVVAPLCILRNLQALNVSFTEFSQHGLKIIAEDLPCLEFLDISCTDVNDISPLRKGKCRLKSLKMYNLQFDCGSDPVGVVIELTHLVHLDVSSNATSHPITTETTTEHFNVPRYLSHPKVNPNLIYLDVSGAADVGSAVMKEFLENHSELKFLGLALTSMSEYEMFQTTSFWYKSQGGFKVAGEASEEQILESLQRYLPRCHYMQKSLFNLFSLSQGTTVAREDIIKLVLPAMRSHLGIVYVQIAATACLQTFTRQELGLKIHPTLLTKCVDLTLTAMENFPDVIEVQKNALMMFCSDRILYNVNFDRFRCLRLVMESMSKFNDSHMDRMSVALCSIMGHQISTEQITLLSAEARYMKKLLQLLKARVESQRLDRYLRFTLNAIWNLSDDRPSTCDIFLKEGGLEVVLNLLEVTEQSDSCVKIETQILCLLNNLANIKTLRHQLIREDLIRLIRRRLHTKHDGMAYLAAGILAYLCRNDNSAWQGIAGLERLDVLRGLVSVLRTRSGKFRN